ncbi:MAG TPA: hypothetical protein VH394_27490, partial [Thermoanaerobaculia bacterium]|nr:hypothetical protein [Thermoanaerobaculia bacterium]
MKFLFCSLATPGMLFPSIGIALALRQRGHQVAFATHAVAGATLESAGLHRIPRGDDDGASFQIEFWGLPLSIAMQVKHVEYALQRFQPDVIVSQQLALGPLLAAERHSLPIAVVGLAAYLWPASEALLHRPPETLRERRNLWRYEETTQIYNQVRGLFGMPPREGDFRSTPLLGDLFLLQSTAELEGDADDLPERVHLVGACLWEPEEEDPDLERWIEEAVAAGESILYVHHGRSFDLPSLWPMIIEVLGARSVRVAASTLRMD